MITRSCWLFLGLLCLTCGLVGLALPLVPTTPFLLLAAYAFARSSPRLHRWLTSHAHFGPPLRHWQQHRAIGRRAKQFAVLSMAASLLLSWLLAMPLWIMAIQAAALAAAAGYILTRPTAPDSPG